MKKVFYTKFPSIENHYQQKHINRFVYQFGKTLTKARYIVELKDDGSNLSLLFNGEEKPYIASRNDILGGLDTPGFFGVAQTLEKYQDETKKMQQISIDFGYPIQFYGEYAGAGIQKRIDYGKDKFIHLFTLRIFDDILNKPTGRILSVKEFDEILEKYGLLHMRAYSFGIFDSLEEAMAFNVEDVLEPSNPVEGNQIEGVVIKPYDDVFVSPVGEMFYIKKKSIKFSEKKQKKLPKTEREEVEISPRLIEMKEKFLEYITENRLEGIFSKMGKRIEHPKQIREFLPAMLDDAIADFEKDNDEELGREERKIVCSVHKEIVQLLKEAIGL